MAVVVSCLAGDLSALARLAHASAPFAERLELRLDALESFDEEAFRALVAALGKPVIAACNGPEGYGRFLGPTSARFERLRAAARAGASFVDVDWRLAAELGDVAPAQRVISRHEPATRPLELAEWLAELDAVARPGDLRKLVHESGSAEEALELLLAVREARGTLIGFSAGDVGRFSRLLAPLAGAPWTYAAPRRADGGATAPGQWPVDELAPRLAHFAGVWPELYGVVGRPVAHSLSPALHGAHLAALGRRALYVRFEAHDFARFARAARALGVRGLSITAPFKRDALELADLVDAPARELGSANTWVATPNGFRATNTDLVGVRATLERAEGLLGRPCEGVELCVLGAGGAARAVLAAGRERRMRLAVAARRFAAAESVATEFGARALHWDELATRRTGVLFHATSVGWRDDECVLPAAWLHAELVIDALYRSPESELLRRARERGVPTLDGETWFLAQAAEQAREFTGVEPDRLALLRSFRAANRSMSSAE
ncbi:MAG: type I 3-dehydroquinate dehydratase [Planctomycetes bacterium]|nr:type I 3-dehydroquinate dehydratase [Planctomycetota bacterium]